MIHMSHHDHLLALGQRQMEALNPTTSNHRTQTSRFGHMLRCPHTMIDMSHREHVLALVQRQVEALNPTASTLRT